jgi:hypothetical protein
MDSWGKGGVSTTYGSRAGTKMKVEHFNETEPINVRSTRQCCQGALYCERFDFAGTGIDGDYTRKSSDVDEYAAIQCEERKRRGNTEQSVLYEASQ